MSSAPAIHYRPALASDAAALARLFADVVSQGDDAVFHPHPFTPDEALRLSSYSGRDAYLVAVADDSCLAWGMLRGWDAGYEIPSLGIYVRADCRSLGLGRSFMEYMRVFAAIRGSPAIMLKVYPANSRAQKLYRSLGYQFEDQPQGDQLVGRLHLSGKRSVVQ